VLNPAKYYKNNVIGSYNLHEAMKITGINKIIFSSTCVASVLQIKSLYQKIIFKFLSILMGKIKFTVEKMRNDYDTAYGIHNVSLRYFNHAQTLTVKLEKIIIWKYT